MGGSGLGCRAYGPQAAPSPCHLPEDRGHPRWKVQSALDEAGIEYEVVKEPIFRWNRADLEQHTGQRALPAIEFEDGTYLREESAELAARIKEGRLTPDGLRRRSSSRGSRPRGPPPTALIAALAAGLAIGLRR